MAKAKNNKLVSSFVTSGPLIGAHVSIAGSIDQSVERAKQMGCTTFQIFTRNPNRWAFKKLSPHEIEQFREKAAAAKYDVIVSHMPYLPNISSPSALLLRKSIQSLVVELERCGQLGVKYVVTHIGSHMGKGTDAGIKSAVRVCQEALAGVDNDVTLLLENMAGQRNSVGSTIENIAQIVERIAAKDRLGVCIDTCHSLAAGYEIRNKASIEQFLEKFDSLIGLSRLKVIHINDSRGGLGSHLDRHEHIGLGYIGDRGFREFLRNKNIRSLPLILETPEDKEGNHLKNLNRLRSLLS